jgi:hypothetical protein
MQLLPFLPPGPSPPFAAEPQGGANGCGKLPIALNCEDQPQCR